MPDPLVSVAMSVHNGARTVAAAIRSILWQTLSDWELILINDASTDETEAILSSFRDPRIRVIDQCERKGLATRLNQSIDHARGKYIARMDADDVAYPERFERQVRYLESHPDVDLLGHGAVLFKGEGEVIGLYPTAQSHEEICRRPWWGFPLAHPTWMGKRAWFDRHRYDSCLTKGQDQELLLRSYRDSRFAALQDSLLGYRVHQVSVRRTVRGRYFYCRALLAQVHDSSSALMAGRGILVHALAFSRDVFGEVVRADKRVLQHLGSARDEDLLARWATVWSELKEEQTFCLT
jgi:glycosyltransferase involved in cell wall biosynthesis